MLFRKEGNRGPLNSEMKWILCSLEVIDYCFQDYPREHSLRVIVRPRRETTQLPISLLVNDIYSVVC